MTKFAILSALALVAALVAPARATYCPEHSESWCGSTTSTTLCTTTSTTSTTSTTLPEEEGCPEPPPCQTVTCNCSTDVCVDGSCTNASVGTDGEGACSKDSDCINGTVNNTTTVNNITVNRCPEQEDLIPCHRRNGGRLVCPSTLLPKRELVPYSKAQKLGNPRHKGKAFRLPPIAP